MTFFIVFYIQVLIFTDFLQLRASLKFFLRLSINLFFISLDYDSELLMQRS